MCMMSAEAQREARIAIEVSQTKLFARVVAGVEYLVYEMALDTSSEVAMILPLPVAQVADDAVEFLDFSAVPGLFRDLAELFPPSIAIAASMSRGPAPQSKPLVVHNVGSFEASYVPTLADMDRLDKRFRIPEEIWGALPEYASFGFAVFKLKSGKHTIHPMAMKFATAEPQSIFFPTVHVHDGLLHDTANFDHLLYFQTATTPAAHERNYKTRQLRGNGALAAATVSRTRGAVSAHDPIYRLEMHGSLPNTDTRVAIG